MAKFGDIAHAVSVAAGRPWAFALAFATVLVWAVTGPVFRYSDTWQLVINTGTTIITFLMCFLIQGSQNRDTLALHAKLDELIHASAARDEFAGIDRLSEDELRRMRGEKRP